MGNIWSILFDSLVSIFKMFFKLFIPVIYFVVAIFLLIVLYVLYFRFIKKIKPIKKEGGGTYKERNFLSKIFVDFPKQMALDFLEQDPNAFGEFGIHMFCGPQGSGKTISAIYIIEKWRKQYLKLMINSNIYYKYSDNELETILDILKYDNGIYGQVNLCDEIQSMLSSSDSRNIPAFILGEISQQRKQKKAIVGTAQIFGKVAKPLREQTSFVYLPKTYFNCLTIVRVTKGEYYNENTEKFTKFIGMFFFIQNKELRSLYDTFEKVKKYKNMKWLANEYNNLDLPTSS